MATQRREILALSGAILASVAGCVAVPERNPATAGSAPDPDVSDARVDPDVGDDVVETLVQGNTTFAFDLFAELVDEAPDDDHFVSPFSISMALAMTWAGARGDTEAATADALSFLLDQDDLHPAFNALDRALHERSDREAASDDEEGDPLTLNIANALWPQAGLGLREEFLDTMAAHYGARPIELDFAGNPAEASETINDWVAGETEGKIDNLVSEGDVANTPLVLTNAIYFLAGWLHEFDEADTEDTGFTGLDGSTGDVSLMSQAETFPYAEVNGHQLVELPYVGEDTSMVIILPAEEEFEAFEEEFDAGRLDTLVGELDAQYGRIELPRFELGTSYGLKEVLEPLGMEAAFSGGADFTGMVEGGGLYIGNVLHDAFVAVDEEGTEAAAATAVIMGDGGQGSPEFEMTVDRPFLFLIRDRPTETVLFLGRVVGIPDDS